MLFTLAWRNLWRNRSRTLITMASVFFAVLLSVFTMSLQKGVWDNLTKNVVSFYAGYAQIHLSGYWDEQVLDNSFAYSDSLNQIVLQQPHITGTTPRLESFALASSEQSTKGSIVVGVDPEKENMVTKLENKLTDGKFIQLSDTAVLVAEGLAKKLQLGVSDTIVLIGQGYHGSTAAGKYPIKGIVKFASPELNAGIVYLPLLEAQNLYGAPGMLTSLVLSLDDPSNLNKVVSNLRPIIGNAYEVMPWQEMMPEIQELIRTKEGSTYIIIGILYLLVAFGIFGTLLMMTAERRYEFGMLMAIGMKRKRLAWVVLVESLLVTITGCLVGVLVAIPLVSYLHTHPIRFSGQMAEMYEGFGFEPIIPTVFSPPVIIEQTVIVTCIALVLSLYPLVKVFTLNEVEAMKR
jgi:putative ABC transport system permease protein